MAEEPQKPPPVPLRLQPDYQRLRSEERALRDRLISGSGDVGDELKAKQLEVIDYIRSHKQQFE